MVMPRKLTDEQIKRVRELWNEGYSRADLADRFGVSIGCIGYILKKPSLADSKTAGILNRKYELLAGELYDKERIFYHLNKSLGYIESMKVKLSKRFPEYKEYFQQKADICNEVITSIEPSLRKCVEIEWDYIQKGCKEIWREFEKKYRSKNGKSSKNHLRN